jgi:hypothetical protein
MIHDGFMEIAISQMANDRGENTEFLQPLRRGLYIV